MAMEAGGEAERLRYYQTLAAAELFLLLEAEAEEDDVVPQAFEVEGRTFVLAFDTEERLAEFAGAEAHYVALSGRAVAEMLAEAGLGLGLNLESGPQAALLPNEAMSGWPKRWPRVPKRWKRSRIHFIRQGIA